MVKTLQRMSQLMLSLLISALVLTGAAAQEGDFLMDIGFRPDEHGFSFPNYGNDSVSANLTAVEMVRLFGEKVCSGPVDDQATAAYVPRPSCGWKKFRRRWMVATAKAWLSSACSSTQSTSACRFWRRVSL